MNTKTSNFTYKKLFAVLLLLCHGFITQAQWVCVDTMTFWTDCNGYPTGRMLSFVDTLTAFSTVSRPTCSPSNTAYFTISKTNDSFQSFTGFEGCGGSGFTTGYLYDMDLLSRDTAFLSYYCNTNHFRRTFDGGSTWTELNTAPPGFLTFVHANLGYGFNGNSLYRFHDDTLNFVSIVPGASNIKKLIFADSLTGLMFTSSDYYKIDGLFRTINGGLTWNSVSLMTGRSYYSVDRSLDGSAFIFRADSNYTFISEDTGATWQRILPLIPNLYLRLIDKTKFYYTTVDDQGYLFYHFSSNAGFSWNVAPVNNSVPALYGDPQMMTEKTGYLIYSNKSGNGHYYYILKTTNNCGLDPNAVPLQKLVVVPNPNNGKFTLNFPESLKNEEVTVRLFNSLGALIMESRFQVVISKKEFEIPSCAKGVYFLTVYSDKSQETTRIIVGN